MSSGPALKRGRIFGILAVNDGSDGTELFNSEAFKVAGLRTPLNS